jgi:hypothetical protein
MQALYRNNREDSKVWNQQSPVEPRELVNSGEGVVPRENILQGRGRNQKRRE